MNTKEKLWRCLGICLIIALIPNISMIPPTLKLHPEVSPAFTDPFSSLGEETIANESVNLFLIDINNDNNTEKAPGYPNPLPLPNPCGDVRFRLALWHLMNRSYVTSEIWNGTLIPQYTVIPHPGYKHPDIRPGGPLELLSHPYDLGVANSILDAADYTDKNNDTWRDNPDGSDITLIFYARKDDPNRTQLAQWYTSQLNAAHLRVDLRIENRSICHDAVIVNKTYHLYTGGWVLGPEPEHLIVWMSDYYKHPYDPNYPNYNRVNCTEFDDAARHFNSTRDVNDGYEAQKIFNNESYSGALGVIPVCATSLMCHDIAITDVSPSERVVVQGHNVTIHVTLQNQGNFTETCTLWTFCGFHGNVTLSAWALTMVSYTFNTSKLPIGNYTVWAYVLPCFGDQDPYDNTYVDGVLEVVAGIHDVAVTDVTPNKTIVGQGYPLKISVNITNQGDFFETFNVTAYGNTTEIGKILVTNLGAGENTTLIFTWDTTGFTKGNYTIRVIADKVQGEFDIADNSFIDDIVKVAMAGDINGDGIVDIFDIVIVAAQFGRPIDPPLPITDQRAEINGDGVVDIFDLVIVAANFGQTDP